MEKNLYRFMTLYFIKMKEGEKMYKTYNIQSDINNNGKDGIKDDIIRSKTIIHEFTSTYIKKIRIS